MKQTSVRAKIGIELINDDGEIVKSDGSRVVFFRIEPSNLAVLSAVKIREKIVTLANLSKVMGMMDMYALDDRENYTENLRFIQKRIDEERSPEIRHILEEEAAFVKMIEADSSSARIFLIAFHIPENDPKIESELKNFIGLANQSMLQIFKVDKAEIKKIIAVYFKHDTVTEKFPDFDGDGHYDDVNLPLIRSMLRNGETPESIENDGISFGGE